MRERMKSWCACWADLLGRVIICSGSGTLRRMWTSMSRTNDVIHYVRPQEPESLLFLIDCRSDSPSAQSGQECYTKVDLCIHGRMIEP